MDLFKLRRDGSSSESDPSRSLEKLLTTPLPPPPATSPESPPPPPPVVNPAATASESTSFPELPAMRSESVISEGFHFNGVIKSPTDLRVDGTLEGDIDVRSLVIGKSGSVSGQCRCDLLHIEGGFQGKAECRELHLATGSAVDGEVTYSVLRAQRGAQITGKYIHRTREAS